jgi:hypothetical protein
MSNAIVGCQVWHRHDACEYVSDHDDDRDRVYDHGCVNDHHVRMIMWW